MAVIEDIFTESLFAIRVATSALPTDTAFARSLDDGHLLEAQRALAEARRAIDASASVIAGEVAHRSRRELGYDGLAQKQGFRTPEKLVQHTTGSTARDAAVLVTVGSMVHDAELAAGSAGAGSDFECREPWLVSVGGAVAAGILGVDAAQAIRAGLGQPDGEVTAEQLESAAVTLIGESDGLHADALLLRARQLRDDLDLAGVAERELQVHEARSIRRVRRPNGLSRFIIDPDIEAAAFWDDMYDRVTAPRRGNVSFISEADQKWADAASDDRSIDQYVHDTFTELMRIAVASETPGSRAIIGSRQPSVRVLVTAEALETGVGVGRIEGISTPISIASVEQLACADGVVPITFDAQGNPLDLGREQRLFTARQRVVLAARDGGCRFPGCDRPPSWTEAHHIDHWKRDQGRTDVDRGVLLCRHHHMLAHNNGWEITRDEADYWLIPPASIDPQRMPRPMPTKSAALRDLLRQHQLA